MEKKAANGSKFIFAVTEIDTKRREVRKMYSLHAAKTKELI